MKNKKLAIIFLILVLLLVISLLFTIFHVKTQISDLFKLNKQLQEEGYYMAEFEFKMMGIAYWLDHGHYYTALSRLNKLHKQLKNKDEIKLPAFINKEDEYEFYLNLQNPRTGAFMDDSYPSCTFNEPTENILSHLAALAEETGHPLNLKYPLKYLDEINTPETLQAFLNDVSNVGWIAAKLPQTTFLFARSLLSYYNGEGVMDEKNLYRFSPEWKQALLHWFYANQDPQTGFWGPKSRMTGKIMKKDLTNTASVIKTFIDRSGNDIHASFPLRYKKEMFKTALEVLGEPMPDDKDMAEWHEWSLKMGKGTTMLTRYLWDDASRHDKETAKALIEDYIKTIFEKYYVSDEGAFSHYPNSEHATLDGTGGKMNELNNFGFFSAEEQKRLWDNPKECLTDLGKYRVSTLAESEISLITDHPEVNSLRLYETIPDYENLSSDVLAVFYPKKTSVRDIMDFTPKVKYWLESTAQSMGNWSSKQEIMNNISEIEIKKALVYDDKNFWDDANELLQRNKRLIVVGFDVLQVPRYMIIYEFV